MRPECVVPEYQCAIKREAKRAIKDKDKPNSTTKDTNGGLHSPNTPQMMLEEKQPLTPQMPANNAWNGGPNGATTPPGITGGPGANVAANGNATPDFTIEISKQLSAEQGDVIRKLVYYQDEFESPSEDDVKKIAVSDIPSFVI